MSKLCTRAAPGIAGGLSSRHAQIYSIDTERLLCAFPEDGYQRVYGMTPAEAASQGTTLRTLWESSLDKKAEAHAQAMMMRYSGSPISDPISLELQIRTCAAGPCVDVQTMLFRWGRLLFVFQQIRGDGLLEPAATKRPTTYSRLSRSTAAALGAGDTDSALLNYNLQTPPSDDPAHSSSASTAAAALQASKEPASHLGSPSILASYAGPSIQKHQQQYQQSLLGTVPETRPFSIPRAPVAMAAALPVRLPAASTVPDSTAPPRRQSSYTLPPVKSFEERRFSHPIQAPNANAIIGGGGSGANNGGAAHNPTIGSSIASGSTNTGSNRPTLLSYQHPLAIGASSSAPASASASAGPPGAIAARGSPVSSVHSPSARLSELRQRAIAGATSRASGPLHPVKTLGDTPSAQPTPTISPLTSSIVHHTPVSLSPAPLSLPHSAGSGAVQVNIYPPPETSDHWRWSQTPTSQSQSLKQQPHVAFGSRQQQQLAAAHHQTPTLSQQQQYHFPHQQPALQSSFSAISSQRPPPPLPIARHPQSPYPYSLMHSSLQENYQSPIASSVASPSIVGTPTSAGMVPRSGDPEKKTCKSCGTDSSPEWRKGPTGHKT
ncbi:hypothetical protein GGI07_004764 [Coemansia sp. Benny D115]|nr:hypothetical protein GGI07_004764 [Coemansia sp. Benny D115]